MARIRITGDGTVMGTRVELDGEQISHVRRVAFSTGVGEKCLVTLEISHADIDIDTDTHLGTVLCMNHKPKQHRDGRRPWCTDCGQE